MSALPSKYVPVEFSVLGVSARLIEEMGPSETVSSLWDRVKGLAEVRTFDRFAEALTVLFAARLISIDKGVMRRVSRPEAAR
jgi:hypothetical protein